MAYTGSKARVGRATVVSIGPVTGGTGAFTPIGEVMKSGFSGAAWGTVDVTNFDSGVDEEFITTTRNNGDVTIEGNLVDTDPGQVLLTTAYNSGSKYNFTVQLAPGPGETTGRLYAFSALVSSLDTPIDTKAAVSFSCKLKVSGAITVTPGA
jgi:hypothetical protein